MSVQRPLFPPTIDSTLLSTFRSCPRKFYMQYVEHWKPNQKSIHLHAGGAFASGLEAARKAFYTQGKSQLDAEAIGMTALVQAWGDYEPPAGSTKTLERMLGALEFYYSRYPFDEEEVTPITFDNDGKAIEFGFAVPLDITHPQTGEQIIYTGRTDMIANHMNGRWIHDDKTTSSLGNSWLNQWQMRSQFTGYQWAAGKHGIETDGTIIRGISILKTKYDTLQVEETRSRYELDRFEVQLYRDIERMLRLWEEGYWDFNLDGGCTEYGGCAFVPVCKSQNPEDWLQASYIQHVWDPLARRELSVEEHEEKWGYVRETPRKIFMMAPVEGDGGLDELF